MGRTHSVLVIYTWCGSYTLVLVIYTRCWSHTLGVGHIHLVLVRYTQWVWFIYTRVGHIHMLGLVYIHSVLVIYTQCGSYTLGLGHIHSVGLVYMHSVLIIYTRCWSYTHDVSHICILGGTKEPHAQLRRDFLYWSPCNLHALSLNSNVASITGKVTSTLSRVLIEAVFERPAKMGVGSTLITEHCC